MTVRTRFAPSPTGHVHIGNIRAAIFNWLFARHEGGAFLLRLEDTDRERSTEEAVRTVREAMDWLGLDVDEAPVFQSRRTEAHRAAAEDLLARGHAYREDKGGTGQGEAVVFRMPGTDIAFRDQVKGDLAKKAADLKDFVIVRSNGTPVFHLANVVDDIHMGITHVIRGDDHVENTFRHLALYRALGAPAPTFAHLPMIVNHQGKPYAKRDGDAYVGDFRDKGFLPEALLNYLALLGWSPGDDREVMSRAELVEAFTLGRVVSSPARMDPAKLLWMNGEHLRRMPRDAWRQACDRELARAGLDGEAAYVGRVLDLLGDRIRIWTDVAPMAAPFLAEAVTYDETSVQKRLKREGVAARLRTIREAFATVDPFEAAGLEAALQAVAAAAGEKPAAFIHPVRVAASGQMAGPSLYEMLEVIGRDRVLARLADTADRLEAGTL